MTPNKTLPDIRHGFTKKLSACNLDCYITVNFFDDTNDPCEIFIRIAKVGSTISGFIDVWAMTISKALRSGVHWDDLKDLYLWQKFEPNDQNNPSLVHAISMCISTMIKHRKDLWDEQQDIDLELDVEEQFNKGVTNATTTTSNS